MALKTFLPTSPGLRGKLGASFEEITKFTPEKSLLLPLRKKGGRNNRGVVTTRHRGGGAKRQLRVIDLDIKSSASSKSPLIQANCARLK